jgi:hypothetical protein
LGLCGAGAVLLRWKDVALTAVHRAADNSAVEGAR